MPQKLLDVLMLGRCSHEFSWPRRAADGHYYQVCLLCAAQYQYDWKTMRRTARVQEPEGEVTHDGSPENQPQAIVGSARAAIEVERSDSVSSQKHEHVVPGNHREHQPVRRVVPGPATASIQRIDRDGVRDAGRNFRAEEQHRALPRQGDPRERRSRHRRGRRTRGVHSRLQIPSQRVRRNRLVHSELPGLDSALRLAGPA